MSLRLTKVRREIPLKHRNISEFPCKIMNADFERNFTDMKCNQYHVT